MMVRITGIGSQMATAESWRFHLSPKDRVLIANSLMISIIWYALQFLAMPAATSKALEKRILSDDVER